MNKFRYNLVFSDEVINSWNCFIKVSTACDFMDKWLFFDTHENALVMLKHQLEVMAKNRFAVPQRL